MKTRKLRARIKIICALLGVCLMTLNLDGQDMERAFQLLSEEKYAESEEIYKKLLSENQYSPELLYNLGMVNYYQKDVGEAVLYLEKALKYKPNYGNAKKNLKQVKSEMTDGIYELKPFFLKSIWNGFTSALPLLLWRCLSFVFLGLCLYSTYMWLLNNDLDVKKRGFYLLLLAFVMLILSVGAQFYRTGALTDNPYAVITAQAAYYEGPNELSEVKDKYIPAGTKVLKLETYAEWIKVRLPDAEHAYLKASMMEDI